MKKYLKIIFLFFFIFGIFIVFPIVFLKNINFLYSKEETFFNLEFKKELDNKFIKKEEFDEFLDKKTKDKKNFIIYFGGDFCVYCKKLKYELDKEENLNIKNKIIFKHFLNEFSYKNKKIQKEFRDSKEWIQFWKENIIENFRNNIIEKFKNPRIMVPFFIFFEYSKENGKYKKFKIVYAGNLSFESLKRKILNF